MADIDTALRSALTIDGAIGAALVDCTSGMALGAQGSAGGADLALAAAGATDVVRALLRSLKAQELYGEVLEDLLVTLRRQYHLIRPLTSRDGRGLFLYLVLDRTRANLGMARHRARIIETELQV